MAKSNISTLFNFYLKFLSLSCKSIDAMVLLNVLIKVTNSNVTAKLTVHQATINVTTAAGTAGISATANHIAQTCQTRSIAQQRTAHRCTHSSHVCLASQTQQLIPMTALAKHQLSVNHSLLDSITLIRSINVSCIISTSNQLRKSIRIHCSI